MATKENLGDPTLADIWSTLSVLNVEKYIEEKMGLKYLPWADAWDLLMKHSPYASMVFGDPEIHADESMTVHCSVYIGSNVRTMWLPVMDNRNRAIKQPDARMISDAKMRCFVKCVSLYGLGLYIYQGEDLPREDKEQAEEEKPKPKAKPTPTPAKNKAVKKGKDYEEQVSKAKSFVKAMGATIIAHDTEKELKGFWSANKDQITWIQNELPDLYEELIVLFTNRKIDIKEKKGA